MSNDPMVMNEPVATGWLRTELYGDPNVAALYTQEARALLGTMRSIYGVNERIAAGEGGGFYQRSQVLADGTTVETITNDGLDTIRIYPVAPAPVAAPVPEPKKPKTVTHLPYLWLGVRIVSGGLWAEDDWHYNTNDPVERRFTNVPHVCMWQPPVQDGGERTILSNREDFWPTSDMGLRGVRGDFSVLTVPLSRAEYPLYYQSHFIPAKTEMYGVDTRVVYTDQKLCLVRRHNSLGLPMTAPDADPAAPEVTWDFMFIGDPMNDIGIDGTRGEYGGDIFDPQVMPPVSAEHFSQMADATGGEYFFKLALEGRECRRNLAEPVVIEVLCIVGRGETRIRKSHMITLTEATDYSSGLLPRGIYWSEPPSIFTPTVRDFGPNRHGPHWWQGMATIFVPPAQVEVPVDQAIPPSIRFSPDGEVGLPPGTDFEPGPYFPPLARCPGGQYF